MKRLKPGQIGTLKGHVYRCKKLKNTMIGGCAECCNNNNTKECILIENNIHYNIAFPTCASMVGLFNYPHLIK